MLIIGLTGGIASGKSVITKALQKEPGIVVIDADKLAWETYKPGTAVYKKLVGHFGKKISNKSGEIDRKKLGKLVFSDERERKFLNAVVHPTVGRKLRRLAKKYEAEGAELMLVEAALLLESAHVDRSFFDCFVVVKVDPEDQIKRLMARDGISRRQALKKIKAQAPQEDKLKRADYVIDASGTPKDTIARAKKLFKKLQRQLS